jgi:hypothetical protein
MTDLTITARLLSPMIVRKESFSMLRNHGLLNVYTDDYGHKYKYDNCLYYLFDPSKSSDYLKFERTLADFASFYDWYPVDNLKMYVFHINPVYGIDLVNFKQNRFDNFGPEFNKILERINLKDVYFDPTKEIYRFSEHLLIKKGS